LSGLQLLLRDVPGSIFGGSGAQEVWQVSCVGCDQQTASVLSMTA
jgi:hypothetical protein